LVTRFIEFALIGYYKNHSYGTGQGGTLSWTWEPRGEASFQTPEVSGIYEGWREWPADLAFDESQKPSEIFTRELTQNFMDAARFMADRRTSPPSLTFRFLRLTGSEANRVAEVLGLKDLSEKYLQLSAEQKRSIKLPHSAFLSGEKEDLELLVVTESGTSGMFGRWTRDHLHKDSNGNVIYRRMRDALLDSAGSNSAGSLGSYGEGKRAIIAASNCRSILTYTAFDEGTTDDKASRRLLGATYWRPFNIAAQSFSGLSLYGDSTGGGSRPSPYQNEAADIIVSNLNIPGFSVRDASNHDNWGTSQIFIEPIVNPMAVASALERNWWPKIVNQEAVFEVFDYDGQPVEVSPTENPSLKPFIRCLEISADPSTIEVDYEETGKLSVTGGTVGRYALAVDVSENGWSLQEPESNRSMVALIRDGMLISYQKLPRAKNLPQPFVRGIYEVSRDLDGESAELLRQVEPPLHNFWRTKHDAMDKAGLKLAQDVYNNLTDLMIAFREKFVEELVKQAVDLELFDEFLSVDGSTSVIKPPPPPPPPPSDWEILSDGGTIEQFDDLSRWAKASRIVRLKQEKPEQTVRIEFGWKVEADNGKLELESALFRNLVSVPRGFRQISPGVLMGNLIPGKDVKLAWTSNPYQEMWTLQPFVQVTRLDEDLIIGDLPNSGEVNANN
jgi:hypothetical protein